MKVNVEGGEEGGTGRKGGGMRIAVKKGGGRDEDNYEEGEKAGVAARLRAARNRDLINNS